MVKPLTQVPILEIPRARQNFLWHTYSRTDDLQTGRFSCNGVTVVIEVPIGSTVLFPTDFGLSLLYHSADQWLSGPGDRMLDLGAGSGIYSIYALLAGVRHVTALDVDPACEEIIRRNAALNSIPQSRIDFINADIRNFSPGERFDLVTANPPHMPAVDVDAPAAADNSTALVGGRDGREFYDELPEMFDAALERDGVGFLDHSSLCSSRVTERMLNRRGLTAECLGHTELDLPMGTLGVGDQAAILATIARLDIEDDARQSAQEGRVVASAMKVTRV